MGQEERQDHTFACKNCQEEITLAMHVDYENVGANIEPIENSVIAESTPDAEVVNLDANFLIPEGEIDKEFAFPRLFQMRDMFMEMERAYGPLEAAPVSSEFPSRRPDYAAEWRTLKKAWSLDRRGKSKLAQNILSQANDRYYFSDPLSDLQDWGFRFCGKVAGRYGESRFQKLARQLAPVISSNSLEDFKQWYTTELESRVLRYQSIMQDYFSSFSEFSQVHFQVALGLDVRDEFLASSVKFSETKMFYGNAFEAFTSNVDVLACINNIILGRPYNEFQTMDLEKYLTLDKPGRFRCFSLNEAFSELCVERESKIRNASHHGPFHIDAASQVIDYKSGKGGAGDTFSMSYSEYLVRCSRIFCQIVTLLRLEVLLAYKIGVKSPI